MKQFLFAVFALIAFAKVTAQGVISFDSTFNETGIITTYFDDDWATLKYIHTIPEEKLLVAAHVYTGPDSYVILHYLADGSLDPEFGESGISIGEYPIVPDCFYVAPDGKILIGGEKDDQMILIRLNYDSSVDTDFGADGILILDVSPGDDEPRNIIVTDEGRILVGGRFNESAGIVQLTTEGIIDTSFHHDGLLTISALDSTATVEKLMLQPDQRILAVSTYMDANDWFDVAVTRVHSDGMPDSSFNDDGTFLLEIDTTSEGVAYIDIDPEGKIMLINFSGNFVYTGFNIVVLNADGTPDNTFFGDGIVTGEYGDQGVSAYSPMRSILKTEENNIIVIGNSSPIGESELDTLLIGVFHLNGQPDSSYGENGYIKIVVDSLHISSSFLQPDGKLLIGGERYNGIMLIRLLTDFNIGTVDFSLSKNQLSVFPNPVHDKVVLKYELSENTVVSVSLFDMQGKKVVDFFNTAMQQAGVHETVLNFPKTLQPGNYFISISSPDSQMSIQVFLQ